MITYPIAVSILGSYFVLIIALVWRVKSQLIKAYGQRNTTLFFGLSLVSLAATWTYMFKFFAFSYSEWQQSHHVPLSLDSISYWLHDVSLFDSAWRQVSVGHWQWLWSHQLCSLTVSVWTPILAIEGNRRGIPYIWAYMLLGQVVAISVASSLFFAVMLAYTPTQEPSYGLLKRIAACVVGGLITVILSPFVAEGDGFMPNLLVMHILLILPLMRSNTTPQKPSQAIMMMYTLAAGANLAIYVNQWFECIFSLSSFSLSGMLDAWITVFFHHPAQSSISSDIVCMQLISIAWMLTQHTSILLISLTPIFSASVTLPLHFAWTEYQKSIKAK